MARLSSVSPTHLLLLLLFLLNLLLTQTLPCFPNPSCVPLSPKMRLKVLLASRSGLLPYVLALCGPLHRLSHCCETVSQIVDVSLETSYRIFDGLYAESHIYLTTSAGLVAVTGKLSSQTADWNSSDVCIGTVFRGGGHVSSRLQEEL